MKSARLCGQRLTSALLLMSVAAGGVVAVAQPAGASPPPASTLYAWGSGGAGQLGNGTTTAAQTTPVAVSLPSGVTGTAVAAGADTGYTIGSDGTLYAWGNGQAGQTATTALRRRTLRLSCCFLPVAPHCRRRRGEDRDMPSARMVSSMPGATEWTVNSATAPMATCRASLAFLSLCLFLLESRPRPSPPAKKRATPSVRMVSSMPGAKAITVNSATAPPP